MKTYNRDYNIKKGSHYVNWNQRIPIFHCNLTEVTFEFKPDPSLYWHPARNNDDNDQNKLFGLGFGFNHHKDSIRITWRPDFDNEGMIEYLAYWYDGEERKSETFGTFDCRSKKKLTGYISGLQTNEYKISFENNIVLAPNLSPDKKWGLYLRPYVGGDNRAIHSMEFDLKWKGIK